MKVIMFHYINHENIPHIYIHRCIIIVHFCFLFFFLFSIPMFQLVTPVDCANPGWPMNCELWTFDIHRGLLVLGRCSVSVYIHCVLCLRPTTCPASRLCPPRVTMVTWKPITSIILRSSVHRPYHLVREK